MKTFQDKVNYIHSKYPALSYDNVSVGDKIYQIYSCHKQSIIAFTVIKVQKTQVKCVDINGAERIIKLNFDNSMSGYTFYVIK